MGGGGRGHSEWSENIHEIKRINPSPYVDYYIKRSSHQVSL